MLIPDCEDRFGHFPMQIARPSNRRWYSELLFLLALAAGLIAFVVQSGELGTSDAQHRLQTAHSWWTGEPAVFPDEYPGFGVHGRGGRLQGFYGIGQSILVFPTDVIGTYVSKLPVFANYNGNDPSVTNIVVSYSTNILLNVLTALVCFRFLRQLNFGIKQAVAGVLALLLLTTHLHYTQNMQENNYIFLLTLTGFSYQYEWLLTGSRRALLIGSSAFGLNLLTRITTGMDLLAGCLFILLVLWLEGARGRALWHRIRSYLAIAFPVFVVFGFLDRLVQFIRFGSFFNTYAGLTAIEMRQRDPSLPANYPFTTPEHVGVLGALFAKEKSIFLFDPLLILAIVLAVVAWRRFSPAVKAYSIAAAVLLLVYIAFYARYFAWAGDWAWGDRYVSTSAEFAALLAVPLLLRLRFQVAKPVWILGIALVAISAVVQMASLAFWLSLEEIQAVSVGRPAWVIALRLKNIFAFATGKMEAWGLSSPDMTDDAWDYEHVTCWNFLPFVLQRVGQAPMWVVRIAFAVWTLGIAALAWTLWRLRRSSEEVNE
jgi:hypothetical protein